MGHELRNGHAETFQIEAQKHLTKLLRTLMNRMMEGVRVHLEQAGMRGHQWLESFREVLQARAVSRSSEGNLEVGREGLA
eukprot:2068399-Amphidinium_carterae.2